MNTAKKERLTNHEKLKIALSDHVGETLQTNKIGSIVSTKNKDFKKGSNLPNDHSDIGNDGQCWCAKTKHRIFDKVKHGHYYVINSGLKTDISDDIEVIKNSNVPETEKKTLIDARIGQGKFRQNLLKYWEEKCAVTRSNLIEILKASHIKPWSKSTNSERLDVFNGLLLSPNLDCLFDRGLIAFDANGKIKISALIDVDEYIKLGINETLSIYELKLTEEHKEYLKYHRQNVYRKS